MSKTLIITDSNSDLPKELLDDNIAILPLKILTSNNEVYSVNEISKKKFEELLSVGINARIAKPTSEEIFEFLNNTCEDADDVMILLSSPCLHDYIDEIAFEEAILEYSIQHIHKRVVLVDSKLTSMALGLLVKDISEMIDKDEMFENILRYVRNNRKKYILEFVAQDKTTLVKHKVISERKLAKANSKNMEYILSLNIFGLFKVKDRVLKSKDANILLLQDALVNSEGNCAIVSSGNIEKIDTIRGVLENETKNKCYTSSINPGNAIYLGPKTLGLCYKKK